MISSASSIILTGGEDSARGTLYAVYEWLDLLGVRFIAADETVIPKSCDWPVVTLASKHRAFEYRYLLVAGQRLRLGLCHMHVGGERWARSRAAVGVGQRLQMEPCHVHVGSGRWAPSRAAVGAGQRLRLGWVHVLWGRAWRAPCCAAVGAGQRLRLEPGQLLGGGARGQLNARLDPGTASLMKAAAAIRRSHLSHSCGSIILRDKGDCP